MTTVLTGWGRTAPSTAQVVTPSDAAAVDDAVAGADDRGVIARGLGRSYGDAAQNEGGTVIDVTSLAAVQTLDSAARTITVEAGASLDMLMRLLVPQGYFLPVTPGTRFVTVGGAVAADIHGKNHHVEGSFANHVTSFTLRAPKETIVATPERQPDVFWGTAGALGLTGVVSHVTFRLLPIETSRMVVDAERIDRLETLMERMIEGDARYRYSVAWIDCMASGRALGRAVLSRGDHAPADALPMRLRARPLRFAPATRLGAPASVPNG